MSTLRTAVLLGVMTALFVGVGFMVGGEAGMFVAFGLAVAMNAFAWWNSDKLVLRMYGARQVDERSAPELHRVVARLAGRAGLPMPKLFVIDNDQPNAFATGRDPEHASVAATTGLLRRLSWQEIAGVMAHELAHVRNRDTLIMTVTATLAGAIGLLAQFGFLFGRGARNNPFGIVGVLVAMIVAPLAAALVQMAVSRSREYAADRGGAEICGNPLWLADALDKIAAPARRTDNRAAEANPATAHLFIVNPLHAHRRDSLFATHPATENRVRALRRMAGGG